MWQPKRGVFYTKYSAFQFALIYKILKKKYWWKAGEGKHKCGFTVILAENTAQPVKCIIIIFQ